MKYGMALGNLGNFFLAVGNFFFMGVCTEASKQITQWNILAGKGSNIKIVNTGLAVIFV